MSKPVVGITVDNKANSAISGLYESSIAYSRAVSDAGGVPVLLPHEPDLAGLYLEHCDALVLTGGVDPRTECFGQTTHPQARPMDERRQAFELALLKACDRRPQLAVLGVCLGMQLMALHRGGRLHQHLPHVLENAAVHKDERHPLVLLAFDSVLCNRCEEAEVVESTVVSSHVQAVCDTGRLRKVAIAPDGVIEAIDDPALRFYLGVQWHPERGGDDAINRGLFARLVEASAPASPGPRAGRCGR
jgi:putative glutamine amidotransferase